MTFKDMMKADMKSVFLNTDECAEAITYVTKPGVSKSINAMIDRGQLEEDGVGGVQTLGKAITILIANDADEGVESVDIHGDYVEVPEYEGDSTATRFAVREILKKDEAGWTLLCIK